jgi:hypothetical protein
MFASCEKESETSKPQTANQPTKYVGAITVTMEGTPDFIHEGVEVVANIDNDTTLNLDMINVKFAENMPMTITMNVAGISYTNNNGVYTFSSTDTIIPTLAGEPFDRFPINNLTGNMDADAMNITFLCGAYPVKFEGAVTK